MFKLFQDLQAREVPRGTEGPKVLLALLGPKDKKEKKVNQDHQDLKVKRDRLDQPDHRVKKAGKVPEVHLDPKAREVQRGRLVCQDLVENQDYLDHLAKMAPLAHRAPLVLKVYKELLGSQEYLVHVGCLVCLVHLECVDCRASLDLLAHQVQEYRWHYKARLMVSSLLTCISTSLSVSQSDL